MVVQMVVHTTQMIVQMVVHTTCVGELQMLVQGPTQSAGKRSGSPCKVQRRERETSAMKKKVSKLFSGWQSMR